MTREWIEQKIKEVHKNAVDQNKNIDELLMWIILDLGKAFEAHRCGRFANWTGNAGLNNFDNFKAGGVRLYCLLKDYEKYIKDTFEDEIADVYIRLFDLCGYLGIDVNSFYHITGWENSFKSSNIAVSFLVITRKICEFHESYIYTIFTELMGLVNELNIPIEKHIEAKMAYNKTRPIKHEKAY